METSIAIPEALPLTRTMAKGAVGEARAGSLPREAYRGLLVLREFYDANARNFAALVGANASHSLSSKILREVLIAFGEGRIERLAFYQVACLDLSSKFATRHEIMRLAGRHLLILRRQREGRILEIVPTERLVSFYAAAVPILIRDMSGISLSRDDLPI